ncbi:MAG: type II toxin-antitoxin system RelE/ParE family toxin [Oscillospiraceae bacterium]|nr:type II toxin-antitoxin system RelE/ParE family toxin [Oscillospiraceae bacterium]
MTKLIVSPLARADMRELGDYISQTLRNPDAALRMIRRFREAMLPLREFPESGAPLLTAGKQSAPYRYLVCGSYLIFYHTAGNAVHIDRVLYGRRDYMAILFSGQLEEE